MVFTRRRVFLFVDVFSTYTFLTRMRSQSMQTDTFSHEELLLLFFLIKLFDCGATQGGATVSSYSVAMQQRVNNTGSHTNGRKAICLRQGLP